ncbi:Olfactory receptor 287 [Fukomys damarensis]|uniref:Olfactory receptor 287 n=1 Tax=Fukomys damarensis TaxID=885580 RepID=A0A091E4H7_FUKDA|nr:Olfactory receptor 287 [Fukomys damarensis]
MHVLTVAGILAIISLVRAPAPLNTMYFFLCNFCFLEIWFTMACMPKALATFTSQSGVISLAGCAAQMYFIFLLGCTEYFLLAAMAYAHYLAILPATMLWWHHDTCPGSVACPGLLDVTLVESSLDLSEAITVLNTIVTPVLNPFIYTLRNKDLKEALFRMGQGR